MNFDNWRREYSIRIEEKIFSYWNNKYSLGVIINDE
jgi:hypothetical protein